MAQSVHDSHRNDPDTPPTGEELATRLFALVMFGVCATILGMIVMSGW
jgi:hypothetical protein